MLLTGGEGGVPSDVGICGLLFYNATDINTKFTFFFVTRTSGPTLTQAVSG